MKLEGEIALVTGSGRGIGRQIAVDLAHQGCRVVITSRSEAELDETANTIRKSGDEVLAVTADVTDSKSIDRLLRKTEEHFGVPSIVINNAGVLHVTPFSEITMDEWDHSMNINLRSVFIISQKALNMMIEQNKGYIINISSTAAITVSENHASYGAAKCGVVGLTDSLRRAARPYGIKVSTVYPGTTDTQMVREHHANDAQSSRWTTPKDISDSVLFLLKTSERCLIEEIVPRNF